MTPRNAVAGATLVFGVLAASVGCASAPTPPPSAPRRGHAAPDAAPRAPLAWAPFDAETFARAKRERKHIVLDGSAEWCHWCHVMEATTYHDPAVRAVLDRHFIAVKVDVDSRPDLEERYGDWGWPATVVFDPDARELAKYRGYIEPAKFAALLTEIVASGASGASAAEAPLGDASKGALSEETLGWIQSFCEAELADYYDDDEGGWGRTQKAPLGWNNAWVLHRAATDADAKRIALFTLDKQAKLIDPVWGGIYQYSAARDWEHPHFEKLMTFQAPALDNYARAYALTRDPASLARARAMHGYIERFLKGPEGGFYTTQDADLNAHDPSRPFMDGHDYYRLSGPERERRGYPRVDIHEYGRENGLAIAAYVTLHEATGEASVLAAAERAHARVLATHTTRSGGLGHDVGADPKVLFLGDNAAMGLATMRLWEATKKPEHLATARRLAAFLRAALADPRSGAYFSATPDPDAAGVFAARRVPFEDNVTALRFLARLARADGDPAVRADIGRVLRGISTVAQIKARGRWLGDYLLALDETRGVR